MKVVITESQYKLLIESNIDKERFKKVAFSIWDKMKKKGERPELIDIIYDIVGAHQHTYLDYEEIRPIWYEYNGGFDVLINKVENEILGKTFNLNDEAMGLNTKFRVEELELDLKPTFPTKSIIVVCEVDKNGMIQYETYDEENEEAVQNIETIEQALYDLEYEQEDLENYLKGEIYEVLEPFTDKKYGVPITIDVVYTDFN